MDSSDKYVYAGFSGVRMALEYFDLGEGLSLRSTYAHLFSPNLVAFAPPGPDGHHPPPWQAARGGLSFDIEIELKAPIALTEKIEDSHEVIWWIAALLRLSHAPYLSVPVLSDHPFIEAKNARQPILRPFEIGPRLFQAADHAHQTIDSDLLDWTKTKWISGRKLLHAHPTFHTALKAFDAATVRGRTSSSLLALWGALEELFAPSPGELRFRVAALLASYLEAPGPLRLKLYKELLKLYGERSVAAHTARDIDDGPLVQTYVVMRNALMSMIEANSVPSQKDLEALLFVAPNSDIHKYFGSGHSNEPRTKDGS